MEQEKKTLSLYHQWRANPMFEYELSRSGQFEAALLAGDIDMFDLTQDVGCMGNVYTRCFYKLNGKDTIFQETPCEKPKIKWKKTADVMIPHFYPAHEATWTYIRNHYTQSDGFCQIIFLKKKDC